MEYLEELKKQKIAEYSAMVEKQINTAKTLKQYQNETLFWSSEGVTWYKYKNFQIKEIENLNGSLVPNLGIRITHTRDGKQMDGFINLNLKFMIHKQINVLDTILTQVIRIN